MRARAAIPPDFGQRLTGRKIHDNRINITHYAYIPWAVQCDIKRDCHPLHSEGYSQWWASSLGRKQSSICSTNRHSSETEMENTPCQVDGQINLFLQLARMQSVTSFKTLAS